MVPFFRLQKIRDAYRLNSISPPAALANVDSSRGTRLEGCGLRLLLLAPRYYTRYNLTAAAAPQGKQGGRSSSEMTLLSPAFYCPQPRPSRENIEPLMDFRELKQIVLSDNGMDATFSFSSLLAPDL